MLNEQSSVKPKRSQKMKKWGKTFRAFICHSATNHINFFRVNEEKNRVLIKLIDWHNVEYTIPINGGVTVPPKEIEQYRASNFGTEVITYIYIYIYMELYLTRERYF